MNFWLGDSKQRLNPESRRILDSLKLISPQAGATRCQYTMEGGFEASTLEQPNRSKGEEIRAKIAANRAKRLAIADAMKREAGVTGHEVHNEDFGGLAYSELAESNRQRAGRSSNFRPSHTNADTSFFTTLNLATRYQAT